MRSVHKWHAEVVTGSVFGALLLGVVTQRASAIGINGKNYFCDQFSEAVCPGMTICQQGAHCGIGPWHKCITDEAFATCKVRFNDNCPAADPENGTPTV